MKGVVIFILTALAGALPHTHGPVYDGMPPERFQHDSRGTVAYVSDIPAHCGTIPNGVIFACTVKHVTYLPNPCKIGTAEWFAQIACHEAGHRQGWTSMHEE